MDLHLRQGLEGQELGDALGVTPGHAYVMLSRMRDQVERSLGALMVAGQGSEDCRKLEAILRPWDGRFTATWRKRVARHVDGCEICGELRKRIVSPAAMLGAIPLIAAPAYAREAVLDKLQLVGCETNTTPAQPTTDYRSERWPSNNGGFPPPMARRRRPPLAAVVAAAIVLVLMLAVPTVALMGSGPEEEPVVEAKTTLDPSYPLVFNDVVLKTPEISSTPEASVEAAAPAGPAGRKESSPKQVVAPKPQPWPTPSSQPAVNSNPRPSPSPSVSPRPPAGRPGAPGTPGLEGTDGVPSADDQEDPGPVDPGDEDPPRRDPIPQ